VHSASHLSQNGAQWQQATRHRAAQCALVLATIHIIFILKQTAGRFAGHLGVCMLNDLIFISYGTADLE
jgi:hypothetical protein